MNRKLKFRGKSTTNKEWKYGIPVNIYDGTVIIEDCGVFNDGSASPFFSKWDFVKPETICQFTGLHDKNGKEIYEGDIVRTKQYGKICNNVNHAGYDVFEIQYINAQFMFVNKERQFYLHRNALCEVIGNIHDNIDLLKDYER